MTDTFILQGRRIGPAELGQVRGLLAGNPKWSRWRLSRELATLWAWRNGVGRLKDMAAGTFLRKLEKRGLIQLPPPRHVSLNIGRYKPIPTASRTEPAAPLTGSLAQMVPFGITELRENALTAQDRPLFEALLHQHHYLSYGRPVGENLQYLARQRDGHPVACLLFGAAAWQCADRDHFVGWDSQSRQQHLHLLANNTRFLILPWVRVPYLASYLLNLITQRLSQDWQRKYGHPLYLVESFVQQDRFAGTAYRAANWLRVGQTQGRSRQDRQEGGRLHVPIKDIYLYPLHPRFRECLHGALRPSQPTLPS